MKVRTLLMMIGLIAVLAACGSTSQPEPIGIGGEPDELKRSPCACLEVQQDYSDWRQAS